MTSNLIWKKDKKDWGNCKHFPNSITRVESFLVYPFQVAHLFDQSVFGVYPPTSDSDMVELDSESIFSFGLGYIAWLPKEKMFLYPVA